MQSTILVRSNVVVRVWAGEQLLRTCRAHNTWGTAGLNALRNWLAGVAGTPITHIAWLDTGGVERARDIVTQRDVTTDGSLLLRQYLPSATSANSYSLTTVRAYNAQSAGTLFAEAEFDPVGVAKTDNIQITVEWTHVFADGGA